MFEQTSTVIVPQPPQAPPQQDPNHEEISDYICENVRLVYTAATGRTIPPWTERHKDNSALQPRVSMSYNSNNNQYAAFVSCNKMTFMNGRAAATVRQALLNLLEATSELMAMFGNGLLQDDDVGVCTLRQSGGRYWNGHEQDRS